VGSLILPHPVDADTAAKNKGGGTNLKVELQIILEQSKQKTF